jgi:hypothetical protein
MGFGVEQLRGKALLALEEACQECRYRKPRRSFAVRFALACLWTLAPVDREPFEAYWEALAEDGMWQFASADRALSRIYWQLQLTRPDQVAFDMWKRVAERERSGH